MTGSKAQSGKPNSNVADFEAVLGHVFTDRGLLLQALTHRSALGQRQGNTPPALSNERFEFLGDRVLGLVIAERLLVVFPEEAEGDLAPRLAVLVSAPTLAEVAETCELDRYVRIAPGQRAQYGDTAVLADACEAVIGALYLDGGLEVARTFILSHWESRIRAALAPPKDSKTALQEWAQARGLPLPAYRLISSDGPPHAPVFVMAVSVGGGHEATGTGRSKRQATAAAAGALLIQIADDKDSAS